MAGPLVIGAARALIDGRLQPDVAITVAGGRITSIGERATTTGGNGLAFDGVLAPGYVDVHVHALDGCGAIPGAAGGVAELGRALIRRGVTGFLATTIAEPVAVLERRLRDMPAQDTIVGARFLGVHLEGPWLSPARPGAQPAEHFAQPAAADFARVVAAGPVRLVTVAPELPGAWGLVEDAVRAHVTVAIGHSDATYRQAKAAVALGASHVTHAFNAMSPLHHREPGLAGAALDLPELTVEVIADGVHVHPAAVRLLWRARGAAGVCLVSDAVDLLGHGRTETDAARRPDGTLAGSVIGLDAAVRNAVSWGVPVADALTMASTTPARAIGRSDIGVIAVGASADLVVLDDTLAVTAAVVGGDVVWTA